MQKTIDKYLKHFACPEVKLVEQIEKESLSRFVSSCSRFIVVPSYDEAENLGFLFESLGKLNGQDAVGVILVVNEKVTSDQSVKERHQDWLLEQQRCGFEVLDSQGSQFLLGSINGVATFIVNRTAEHAFDSKQGVGLARKIGSDLAVYFYSLAKRADAFVFHTDADAVLPENYLSVWGETSLLDPKKISLIIHRYRHVLPKQASSQQAFAMKAYEHYLHYYAENLKEAGSPYGVQTVGSCLGFSALAYCQVRGFPKREAGEDFYLVNKLLKVGQVLESPCAPIRLQGRVSYRVPFGTGASIGRISSYGCPSDYKIYDPKVFGVLEKLLAFANDELGGDGPSTLKLDGTIRSSIEGSGFFVGVDRARKVSLNKGVRLKAFHDWFDGFKTLKLIHLLRDKHYPNIEAKSVLPHIV